MGDTQTQNVHSHSNSSTWNGNCDYQHDRVYSEPLPEFENSRLAFVLDGHSFDRTLGHIPSDFVMKMLPTMISDMLTLCVEHINEHPSHEDRYIHISTSLKIVLNNVHPLFIEWWENEYSDIKRVPGTMLAGILYVPTLMKFNIFTFNIGDSEIRISNDGDVIKPNMFKSVPHDASLIKDKYSRVEVRVPPGHMTSNGKMALFYKPPDGSGINYSKFLSFSRSIGDIGCELSPYINHECDVNVLMIERFPFKVLIATDGLFDMLTFVETYLPSKLANLKKTLICKEEECHSSKILLNFCKQIVKEYTPNNVWDNVAICTLKFQ